MTELSMPVTVVMARRAAPGRASELLAWAQRLCAVAATFPGHLSHKVQEARDGDEATEVVVGLSFTTSGDLVRWEQSEARAVVLEAAGGLTQGSPTPLTLADMDVRLWADKGPPASLPSRWRAALIVWLGLFPPAVVVNLLLEPYSHGWPTALRTLVLTVVLVPVVVLGTVPLLNRALLAWQRRRPV